MLVGDSFAEGSGFAEGSMVVRGRNALPISPCFLGHMTVMTVSSLWRLPSQQLNLTCDIDVNQGIYDLETVEESK
jgi:hypothetical protein